MGCHLGEMSPLWEICGLMGGPVVDQNVVGRNN